MPSDADDRPLGFDLAELVELAGAAAGTGMAGCLPVFGRTDVGVPERPGAALARTGLVNRALAVGVKENAVEVLFFFFFEAFPLTYLADVFCFEIVGLHAGACGEIGDVIFIDPYVAGAAGAAIAAARALELETVFVPGL